MHILRRFRRIWQLSPESNLDGSGANTISKAGGVRTIQLDRPVEQWVSAALAFPNLELLPLTSEIAVASTQLPGSFHRDRADQIIVAPARVHKCHS